MEDYVDKIRITCILANVVEAQEMYRDMHTDHDAAFTEDCTDRQSCQAQLLLSYGMLGCQ